jgi:hypothetical protein
VTAPLSVEVGETEPHGAVGQETLHVTPLFAESLTTVAVNCFVVPACTVAETGDTETEIGSGGVVAVCSPPPQPKLLRAKAKPIRIPASDKRLFEFMAILPFVLTDRVHVTSPDVQKLAQQESACHHLFR